MDDNRGNMKICDVLTVVFIVLKLVGVINWSWIWVLAPFWIPLLLYTLLSVAETLIERRNL